MNSSVAPLLDRMRDLALAPLHQVNQRHPWSHNDHFHRWILANLPARRCAALEVGCGQGELAATLAARFARVDAADADPAMRAATARRCAGLPVTVLEGFAAARGPYDLITMVASLHHLDTPQALAQCTDLLAPGGRLLVVGLARPTSPRDIAWFTASVLANPIIGFAKHPRRHRGPPRPPAFPVRDPDESLGEVADLASDALPGSRLRRRVGFRYTLQWTRP
ncbi:class I SAM-dependent methyltransferase [Tsukamurella soli]|uniref:Class I SAM-dependent methyltransferase n=1 Tax=Tsukamurella soli TaxID=644556 RepID=A0ABP8K7S9_9ACTN